MPTLDEIRAAAAEKAGAMAEFKPNAEFDRYYLDTAPLQDDRQVTQFHRGNQVIDEHAKKVYELSAQRTLRQTRIKEEGVKTTVTHDPHVQRIAQELQFTEQPGKDMIAEMKERMRRDNVSTFFAMPKFFPETTTTQDAIFYDELKARQCNMVDKRFFNKVNDFTAYNEDRIKYKDQMRSGM